MSGKSLAYWQKQWDAHKLPAHNEIKDNDTYKLLNLLKEYAGFSGSSFYTSRFFELTHNKLGWFFKGRWNSNHTTQIQDAIGSYFHSASTDLYDREHHKVSFIFAKIKETLKQTNRSIDKNGDLFRIIKTAELNTGIKFEEIDSRKILKQFEITQLLKKKNVSDLNKELERIEFAWDHMDIMCQIYKLTSELKAEYNSIWPYPNKALKAHKYEALIEMGKRIFHELEPSAKVISDIKRKYPAIMNGNHSTRTKDLLASIENTLIVENPQNTSNM